MYDFTTKTSGKYSTRINGVGISSKFVFDFIYELKGDELKIVFKDGRVDEGTFKNGIITLRTPIPMVLRKLSEPYEPYD